MTLLKLLFRNLRYFLKEHLLLSAGLLTSTAILSSALIIGDSVDYSLKRIASERLGETRHVLLAQERFFPSTLARKIEKELKIPTAAVLLLEGTALNDGRTATELQLCGVDTDFWTFGKSKLSQPGNNEVIINEVLAESLNLQTGDEFLIRIPNPGFVTKNSTFVPDDENRIAVRMKVKAIAGPGDFGNFSLKSNQLTPQTVFFSLDVLSDLLFEGSFANLILIAENRYSTQELYQALQRSWSLEDINLSLRKLEKQAKTELISDRVFIEDTLLNILRETAFNPEPVLTYLVNGLVLGNKLTPYSFVSGLSDFPTEAPGPGEILLNTWLAEDLQAQIGDSIELEYFVPESFRKLNTSRASFRVKDIIPLEGFARDSLLMPAFEGFSGVESCSDWETGIPVDYSSIRPKDELWWSEHRGTPKAFIAYETARSLWGQEYGNSTALRFGLEHAPQAIEQSILNQLHPASMGLNIRDVKQESNWSASNAVDFAQLFLGLSFFLILAALLLSALLFGMLLQQRNKEQGLYRSLGLSRNKIYGIFLSEALLNAFVSSLLGVFAGIGLSKLLLYFINSIWIDIVRTSSIGLFVHRSSLLTGFAANLLVAAAVLLILLKKHFGAAIAHLQKKQTGSRTATQQRTGLADYGCLQRQPLFAAVAIFAAERSVPEQPVALCLRFFTLIISQCAVCLFLDQKQSQIFQRLQHRATHCKQPEIQLQTKHQHCGYTFHRSFYCAFHRCLPERCRPRCCKQQFGHRRLPVLCAKQSSSQPGFIFCRRQAKIGITRGLPGSEPGADA